MGLRTTKIKEMALMVGCLLALATALHAATLVVNFGSYASAERAGTGEANVHWRDADVAEDTVCTECFAACELQHYLRKITDDGKGFPIAEDDRLPKGDLVLIGGPASNRATARLARSLRVTQQDLLKLGPEGYLLRSASANGRRLLLIAGGGRVGTLYGVYDLLHRLGVRWYAPGEVNEEVPKGPLARFPVLDVRETPKFCTRGFHAWEDRGDVDFLLWMARNRLNYWCVDQSQKPLLHKLGIMLVGGGHILTQYYLGPRAPYPYDHPKFTGDEGKPKDPYPLSPQYQGDTNKDGTLTCFEAHPEWYGLRGGKRSGNIAGDGGDNFCTANPDAVTEWMKNAIADLAEGRYKDVDLINAWTLDGGKWCECDNCKALGSPTDRNLLLVHRYAQEIRKARADGRVHRPVRLLFLAYADVLQPPTRPLPADFDYETCIATYFPVVRCYVHSFDDPKCPTNSNYLKHLRGWAFDPNRYYRGQLCIGEYYNVSGYKCLPLCFMSTMRTDLPFYYSLGARHFHYMHCTTGNWGNKALTNWQMARQLWDPGTVCEALWKDYFAGRYGPAAGPMRRFYENLEQMLCNVSDLKYGLARKLPQGPANLFPSVHLKYDRRDAEGRAGPSLLDMLASATRCRQALAEAVNMKIPERMAQRIAEDERLFTYGENTLRFYDALCRTYFALRQENRPEALKSLKESETLADRLRTDKTSTRLSSSHGNAPDALEASFAAEALITLTVLVGPDPDKVKLLDPKQQPLVLVGKEFQQGGALRFGYGLSVSPGRVRVSEVGNYVYGLGTRPYDRMVAWFRLSALPPGDLGLILVGLICPEPAGGDVAGEVRVNDEVVFTGKMLLSEREMTRQKISVPAKPLKAGVNKLEIRNIEPRGRIGSRPWFGIDRIELSTAP